MSKKTKWSYEKVANIYDFLAKVYSLGRIRKSKLSQLERIKPGDKVLYVGVGAGEEAVKAAELGADVTCVDISNKMITLTKNKFKMSNQKANFICADIFEIDDLQGKFDFVVANYFLNNLNDEIMPKMLKRLMTFLNKDGKILIADFNVASTNGLFKCIQKINAFIAVVFFMILGVAPYHYVQDYSKVFESIGIKKTHFKKVGFSKKNIFPMYCYIEGEL